MRWLVDPGAQLDETESMLMGMVQMTSALVLLKGIRVRPLMPLLLTPVLAAAAVPIPSATLLVSRGLRPGHMALTVLLFAVLHEAQRAGVSTASTLSRERKRELAGSVVVHGKSVRRRQYKDAYESEDERECSICSAPDASAHPSRQRSLSSESLASLASCVTASGNASLGPLEAFCTTAPEKHLAHRACFLSWQAAYAQSHGPQRVVVLPPPPRYCRDTASTNSISVDNDADELDPSHLRRAAALVRACPPALAQLSDELLLAPTSLSSSDATLQLSHDPDSATLVSPYPPCPLCRSSTALKIAVRRPALESVTPLSWQRVLRTFVREWARIVSLRTVGMRVLGQGAFLWALLNVMRMREDMRARVMERMKADQQTNKDKRRRQGPLPVR
ncbi:hypothetical protein AURDEDRAFT_143328 [Auricularia subglabra TFB-10046 SS5]|nr:hypothetical protein AURDEDRAFT_143328 [Auricularia subglabra TFB-10046 SS5]